MAFKLIHSVDQRETTYEKRHYITWTSWKTTSRTWSQSRIFFVFDNNNNNLLCQMINQEINGVLIHGWKLSEESQVLLLFVFRRWKVCVLCFNKIHRQEHERKERKQLEFNARQTWFTLYFPEFGQQINFGTNNDTDCLWLPRAFLQTSDENTYWMLQRISCTTDLWRELRAVLSNTSSKVPSQNGCQCLSGDALLRMDL